MTAPQQAQGLRAIPPFALLLIGAAWFHGWGWWSILAPFAFAAACAAVLTPVILILRRRPAATARSGMRFLGQADATAAPSPPPTAAELQSLVGRSPAPFPDWIETSVWLPLWRRGVRLRVVVDDEPGRVWPETAAAIAAIHAWGEPERERVRDLLLADEREAGKMTGEPQRLTAQTVEGAVLVEGLEFVQRDRARAGVGLLNLIPPWEEEHGVAIVIRNGKPASLINRLRDDADEVFG